MASRFVTFMLVLFAFFAFASQAQAAPSLSSVQSSGPGALAVTGSDFNSVLRFKVATNEGSITYFRPGSTAGTNPASISLVWNAGSITINSDPRLNGKLITGASAYPAPLFRFPSFWVAPEISGLIKPQAGRVRVTGLGLQSMPYLFIRKADNSLVRFANPVSAPAQRKGVALVTWSDTEITFDDPSLSGQAISFFFSQSPTGDTVIGDLAETELSPPLELSDEIILSARSDAPEQITLTGDFSALSNDIYVVYSNDPQGGGQVIDNYPHGMSTCVSPDQNPLGVHSFTKSNTEITITDEGYGGYIPVLVTVWECATIGNGVPNIEATINWTGPAPAKTPFTCPNNALANGAFVNYSVSDITGYPSALWGRFNAATCSVSSPLEVSNGTAGHATSPNGLKIAYTQNESNGLSLAIRNADGSGRQVYSTIYPSSDDHNPIRWIDNDTFVALRSLTPGAPTTKVTRFDINPNNTISAQADISNSGIDFVTDIASQGNKVYYIASSSSGNQNTSRIVMTDLSLPLPNTTDVITASNSQTFYSLKTDGTYLYTNVYDSNNTPNYFHGIQRVAFASLPTTFSAMQTVTANPVNVYEISGSHIVYRTYSSGTGVRRVNTDGTGDALISSNLSNFNMSYFRFLPDGQHIIGTCGYSNSVADLCMLDILAAPSQSIVRLTKAALDPNYPNTSYYPNYYATYLN